MKKIRIGKDIAIRWAILTNGEAKPLAGRNLLVELKDPIGHVTTLDFSVEGSTLLMWFYATEQKRLGVYRLTLWENYGKTGQTVVDNCNAFALVKCTDEEGDCTSDEGLDSETLAITSNIAVGVSGKSFTFDDLTEEQKEELRAKLAFKSLNVYGLSVGSVIPYNVAFIYAMDGDYSHSLEYKCAELDGYVRFVYRYLKWRDGGFYYYVCSQSSPGWTINVTYNSADVPDEIKSLFEGGGSASHIISQVIAHRDQSIIGERIAPESGYDTAFSTKVQDYNNMAAINASVGIVCVEGEYKLITCTSIGSAVEFVADGGSISMQGFNVIGNKLKVASHGVIDDLILFDRPISDVISGN